MVGMGKRQLLYQMVNVLLPATSVFMIWKGLKVVTGPEFPIKIVLSESMEPTFQRGDVLFLVNSENESIGVGDVVVFKIEGLNSSIVHRVIKVHKKVHGSLKFLTKGDNNQVDDRALYPPGQNWLLQKNLVGRVIGYLPFIGFPAIVLIDYPIFSFVLMGILGFYKLLTKR